ncbi:metallophosphoesterase [Nocardioides marinquilinus]|uniref:metallophosphoesterase n=1 Tax=Nocardioides marinquilinus TaxID=1210400 RepID=UPI0031EB5EA3
MEGVLRALALLVGLAVVAGYLAFLYRRLVVAPDAPRVVRRVVLGVLAVGGVVFVAAAALLRNGDPDPVRPLLWLGMTEIALALYLTLGLLLLGLVVLPLSLARRSGTRLRVLRVGTPAVVALSLAVTGYGLVEAARPGVVEHEVSSPRLPAPFDGVRVVLLTDLHVGPLHDASWARRAVGMVEAQRPDLVVLGGDLVDGSVEEVGDYLAPLADLDAPLGVVFVTGNHELMGGEAEALEWVDEFERLGVDVLRNESVALTRDGATIALAGVDDPTGTGALAPDPDAALAGVPDDAFTIWVSHQPRQGPPGGRADLQLSGHTHGGQLWPVQLLVPLFDPTVAGRDDRDGVTVITSRGFGTSGPPVRVLAPPAIDVVTLRRDPEGEND